MKKIKRVAVFSHSSSDHVKWVLGLRKGFLQNGVEVVTSWPHPNSEVYNSIVESFRPDVVVEINRSKDYIHDRKHDVCHATIIHDAWAYETSYAKTTGASELYYSILHPSHFGFPLALDTRAKAFIPGIDHAIVQEFTPEEKQFDIGLIGHVATPHMMQKHNLNRLLVDGKPRLGTFLDLLRFLKLNERTLMCSRYTIEIEEKIQEYMKQKKVQLSDTAKEDINRWYAMFFVRIINRIYVARKMLEISPNVAFWGPPSWKQWPSLAPYYKEHLYSMQSLLAATSSLRINVHCTGTNLHSRITDAMSIGVATAVMENDSDAGPFGIEKFFEPDVDFIRFNFDNFSDKITDYLKHPTRILEINRNCQKKMLGEYTWDKICRRMISDFREVL